MAVAVILAAFAWMILAPNLVVPLFRGIDLPRATRFGVAVVISDMLGVVALLTLVLWGERRPLNSVGIRRLSLSDVGLGLAAYAAAGPLTGITNSVYRWMYHIPRSSWFTTGLPSIDPERFAMLRQIPLGLALAMALTAGITEELIGRGYAIERLRLVTGSMVSAAAVALTLDVFAHVPGWGLAYAMIIAPSQLMLVLLYIWRRRLAPCAIAHFLIDATPFVFMALWLAFPALHISHERMAHYWFDKGEYDLAISEATLALKDNPRDAGAYQGRATAYWYKHRYDAAIADFTAALKLDPSNADAYQGRSTAWAAKHDYARAIADLDMAIKRNPGDWRNYMSRAQTESDMKQYNRALADYTAAVKLSPNDPSIYMERGAMYGYTGDWQAAVRDYKKASVLDPRNIDPLNEAAWLMSTAPDPAALDGTAAIRMATTACDLSRWKNAQTVDTLAAAYAQAGDFGKAVAFEQRAIAMTDPKESELAEMRARSRMYRDHHPFRQ